MTAKKKIFFLLGIISLGLAYLGIALPGFPGTPFILLTAYFFVRSSDRMYNWLLRKRLFGNIIREFNQNENIPLKFKLFVILQMWITISVAGIWFIEEFWARISIIAFGIIFSLLVLKLRKKKSTIQ